MRLVYAMHVNWHWIRQRPHVLAEHLAAHHRLTLLHYAMYHRHHRAAEAEPPFPARELMRVPERIKRIGAAARSINDAWITRQVIQAARNADADLLWVTHPDFAPACAALDGPAVVYDCMDDHAAFDPAQAEALLRAERRLVERADLVLFSSATLAARVCERARPRRQAVVNNGVADSLIEREALAPRPAAPAVLGYFGTVSHWFDWPLVLRVLDALPGARLDLAGPVETDLPADPRIRHAGIVTHAALADFVAGVDLLLMPFVVNRLIEAVDPVKLYEYIAFGRPALAPRYPETERFEPWVQLYDDGEDAVTVARRLLQVPPTTDAPARRCFLQANSWSARVAQIESLLPVPAGALG